MPNPTYANLITPQEVSLALEHLLIAPYGTAWTPGRVTVDAPPTGFIHLGAVEDGSPQISINKEAYSFSTGIPSALAYQAITGMSGSIAMTLHTFDAYGAHLASGGLPPVLQANTASNKTWLMLNSPQTRTTLVVSLGASAAPIRVNDMVVTDTTAAINNSRQYAWVTAVSSDTGVNVLTLEGTGLPTTPTIGNPIYPVAYSQFALGTSIIPKFAVLGVADFINGAQVVHYAAKAQPTGEWGEALRGGQHVMVPISMNLFGYTVSTPYSSAGQLVVAERYQFMPTTVQ